MRDAMDVRRVKAAGLFSLRNTIQSTKSIAPDSRVPTHSAPMINHRADVSPAVTSGGAWCMWGDSASGTAGAGATATGFGSGGATTGAGVGGVYAAKTAA